MFRKNYTDEDIIKAVKESATCAEALKKLNLKPIGGNYSTMKRKIGLLGIDSSHWTGKHWSKNKKLKDWKNYTRAVHMKRHLIKEMGNKCQKCLLSLWNNEAISIEVHHIDGDRTNNCIKNLQLLCPNCHAQTHNWRGKKNNPS